MQSETSNLTQKSGLDATKDLFHIPQDMVYLDGNSLGPAPKAAFEMLDHTIRTEWAEDLITSWNKAGWFDMPKQLGDQLGQLIGAGPGQIVVTDTTSVNIYKAVKAAMGLRPARHVIVSELESFPTDLYILEAVNQGGYEIRLLGRDSDCLTDLLDDQVACVLLSHANYRSGALCDMAEITDQVHELGALMIWDLCHTAGVVAMGLDNDQVDFAVGCTYKYLNGGPGSPAYIYVAERHLSDVRQPLSGWWGHAQPFAFHATYHPHPGIEKFLCGTQPIISLRGVQAGLSVYEGLSLADIRAKSLDLTRLFINKTKPLCDAYGLILQTPELDSARASQVSFLFDHGFEVIQAMIFEKVIGDFRGPGLMRFGFAPLYLGEADVLHTVSILEKCLKNKVWEKAEFQKKPKVT